MNAPSDPAKDVAISPLYTRADGEDTPLKNSPEQLTGTGRFALTARILIVNILPLALLGGGLFYLDSYRTQLINERFKLARIEAQITAEALAGATRERQDALLVQIGKEQRMRVRLFDEEGALVADSFALDEERRGEPEAHWMPKTQPASSRFQLGSSEIL